MSPVATINRLAELRGNTSGSAISAHAITRPIAPIRRVRLLPSAMRRILHAQGCRQPQDLRDAPRLREASSGAGRGHGFEDLADRSNASGRIEMLDQRRQPLL